jgi:hypothetical protein
MSRGVTITAAGVTATAWDPDEAAIGGATVGAAATTGVIDTAATNTVEISTVAISVVEISTAAVHVAAIPCPIDRLPRRGRPRLFQEVLEGTKALPRVAAKTGRQERPLRVNRGKKSCRRSRWEPHGR